MNLPDCLAIYEDAEFYDLEFANRTHELPFFRDCARKFGGPILEVACGTGRLTLPLAEDGHDITGLDVSPEMLALARRKSVAAGINIEWLEQDCRDMRLARQFAFIFSATNAMQHLLDLDSACAFLHNVRRALVPDGHFVLDVFNPNPAKLARLGSERYVHKTIAMPDGSTITIEAASHYNAATQVLHFDLFYLRDGALLRTKRVDMRCFFPQELRALFRLNCLKIVHEFGDYDGGSFHAHSPKQIFILTHDHFL